GLALEEVRDFLMAIEDLPSIQVKGLMTMAALHSDAQASRPVFRKLAELRSTLLEDSFKNVQLDYLSMGMSQDFEVAIEEGANIVRIGSALFT
ncbi:MAG: YggS family pyridoxal phosphate enzyme, partial [Syntrophomonadaceae bacterium]|nr:YggS family pyridoxal phosphate enzyme [Syntrophomonadaceae bacterium]